MTFLLDTNVIVDLASRRGTLIRLRLDQVGLSSVAISAITLGELEFGEAKSQRPSRSLAMFREFLNGIPILPFEEGAAREYGKIRAALERQGQIIGGNDIQIASIAKAQNLILVTRDIAEFQRVEGLIIEDWSK